MLRLEKKRAEALSMEEFGHEDTSEDESDSEPTLGVSTVSKGLLRNVVVRNLQKGNKRFHKSVSVQEIAVREDTRADSVTKRT